MGNGIEVTSYFKVSAFSLAGNLSKLLSGPLVLLVISSSLNNEEMALYFSFFNIIAMQQLLEAGVGMTLKHFISHSYSVKNQTLSLESKKNIKSYFLLALLWFASISIMVICIIGPLGYCFFNSYTGSIQWQGAWWLLVTISSINIATTPFFLLVESCQKQLSVYKGRIIYSLSASVILSISLFLGLGLYSLSLSVFFAQILFLLYILPEIKNLILDINIDSNVDRKDIKKSFIDIWPMLSKISLTWISGYFFWNSFNLIAFKFFPIEQAGKFSFTLALARAGYQLADSITSSQVTIFSNEISKGRVLSAKAVFEKYMYFSFVFLLLGYFFFIIVAYWGSVNMVTMKMLNLDEIIYIFIYFLLLLPIVSKANFSRCFKKEPFLYFSLTLNLLTPFIFLIICINTNKSGFLILLPFLMLFNLWANNIYKKTIKDGAYEFS